MYWVFLNAAMYQIWSKYWFHVHISHKGIAIPTSINFKTYFYHFSLVHPNDILWCSVLQIAMMPNWCLIWAYKIKILINQAPIRFSMIFNFLPIHRLKICVLFQFESVNCQSTCIDSWHTHTHTHTHTSSAISDKWNLGSLYIKHSGASPTGGWGRGPDHGWRMPYGRCGRCHTNFAHATPTFCPFIIIGHTNFDLLVNHIMFWPHQLWKPSSAHVCNIYTSGVALGPPPPIISNFNMCARRFRANIELWSTNGQQRQHKQ